MVVKQIFEGIKLSEISNLSLEETLDCGQCFRWKKNDDGNWSGVVKGIYREIRQETDCITIIGADEDEFRNIWYDYFDFGRDYDSLKKEFSECFLIADACSFAPGIRVLHQEPWEAFISFIISQNNNIARIKGIIDRLCRKCGERIGEDVFAFPTPEAMASLSVDDYNCIGCGYRSQYLKSAAENVLDGSIDLEHISSLPTGEARCELLKILGVGPKVADCILLYGMGRTERCPADVWMKRVLAAMGGNMPSCVTDYEGIAQQFLFHYARNFPEKFVINE